MTAVAIPETYGGDAPPYVETDYGGRTWVAYRRYEGGQEVAGWELTLLRVCGSLGTPSKPIPVMSWADVESRIRGT